MKKFFKEFRDFAMKGNVMDLAVGMIVGAAFTAIVTSLVDDILSPLLGLLVRVDFKDLTADVFGVSIRYGSFIMAVINFVIVAFALFLVIRGINRLQNLSPFSKKEEPAPKTKVCPYCRSEIDIQAIRCPHCTTVLNQKPAAK